MLRYLSTLIVLLVVIFTRITLVLLAPISVRDGAFCLDQSDGDLVRSMSDCISRP